MKQVEIVLSDPALEVYKKLNEKAKNSKFDNMILKSLNQKFEFIKKNFQYGDPISKNKIPLKYIKRGIINLFRVELPGFWRMLYTVNEGKSQIEIIAFILDIFDHKEYNKIFGYRDC